MLNVVKLFKAAESIIDFDYLRVVHYMLTKEPCGTMRILGLIICGI